MEIKEYFAKANINISLLDNTNAKETIQYFLNECADEIFDEYIASELEKWGAEECQLNCINLIKNTEEKRFYFDIQAFFDDPIIVGCPDVIIANNPTTGTVTDFFIDYDVNEFGKDT